MTGALVEIAYDLRGDHDDTALHPALVALGVDVVVGDVVRPGYRCRPRMSRSAPVRVGRSEG